jgi:hypothetical protein
VIWEKGKMRISAFEFGKEVEVVFEHLLNKTARLNHGTYGVVG